MNSETLKIQEFNTLRPRVLSNKVWSERHKGPLRPVFIFLLFSVETSECERLFSLMNAEISTTFQADAADTCQHGCCGITSRQI